jgi:hypothetical protein
VAFAAEPRQEGASAQARKRASAQAAKKEEEEEEDRAQARIERAMGVFRSPKQRRRCDYLTTL